MRLGQVIKERSLPYSVINDYPMLRVVGRRARSADLVIRDADKAVVVAAEFKYEPSHRRTDLLRAKLPVVFWGNDGVAKDIERIREFIEQGAAVRLSPSSSMKEAASVTSLLIQGRSGVTGRPVIPAAMKSRFSGLAGRPN